LIQFKKIEFENNLETCVNFREDSFRASFPGRDEWKDHWDECQYRNWIIDHAKMFPDGAVHIWRKSEIIGQLEFAYVEGVGHVSLYYLVPEERGSGVGQQAHAYVVKKLTEHGCKTASLRVSPINLRAVRFYRRLGWVSRGQDPKYSYVHMYEISL